MKAMSLKVATSSVMHCVDGGDIAMLAMNHLNGDDPTSMFLELVDGKENCMANFLVKEAQHSLATHSDILDDIPQSWQEAVPDMDNWEEEVEEVVSKAEETMP